MSGALHEVAHYDAARVDVSALAGKGACTIVTHEGVGEDEELARVQRVCQSFLIADHACLEDQFADYHARSARPLPSTTVPSDIMRMPDIGSLRSVGSGAFIVAPIAG